MRVSADCLQVPDRARLVAAALSDIAAAQAAAGLAAADLMTAQRVEKPHCRASAFRRIAE